MYRVFSFPTYRDQQRQLSRAKQERAYQIEQHCKERPTGKPLGYLFLREKKLNGERILLLIYEEEKVVLLVMITNKKLQQRDIDFVKNRFEVFRLFVHHRLRGT